MSNTTEKHREHRGKNIRTGTGPLKIVEINGSAPPPEFSAVVNIPEAYDHADHQFLRSMAQRGWIRSVRANSGLLVHIEDASHILKEREARNNGESYPSLNAWDLLEDGESVTLDELEREIETMKTVEIIDPEIDRRLTLIEKTLNNIDKRLGEMQDRPHNPLNKLVLKHVLDIKEGLKAIL